MLIPDHWIGAVRIGVPQLVLTTHAYTNLPRVGLALCPDGGPGKELRNPFIDSIQLALANPKGLKVIGDLAGGRVSALSRVEQSETLSRTKVLAEEPCCHIPDFLPAIPRGPLQVFCLFIFLNDLCSLAFDQTLQKPAVKLSINRAGFRRPHPVREPAIRHRATRAEPHLLDHLVVLIQARVLELHHYAYWH